MDVSYQNNMSGSTITSTEFNGRNVTISAPKAVEIEKDGKRQSVGKKAFVNYNGERLVLQSATSMRIPFGLSVFKADGGGQDKYSINLSFNNYQTAGETKAFFDAVTLLDTEVVEQAFKNSKAWFGKDASKEYPPTMKLNLKKTGATFDTKIYDVTGKRMTGIPMEELLAKGTQVTALIECSDVWIAGTGKFNLRWNVSQLVVHKMADKGADFAFKGLGITPEVSNSSSSKSAAEQYSNAAVEEDAEDNLVDDEEEEAAIQAPVSVVAAALEDDDDDEGEAPPPPPKKAVTITKKKPVVAKKA